MVRAGGTAAADVTAERARRLLTAAGFPFGARYGEEIATGVLKMFDQDRGFGFIKPDEGGNDVFVYVSTAERSGIQLQKGMRLGI